jgi:hypothetical protein
MLATTCGGSGEKVDAALAKLPAIERTLATGQPGWTKARLLVDDPLAGCADRCA